MDKYRIEIEFTTPVLGTVPKDKSIYSSYVASKAEDLSEDDLEDELATVEEVEKKGWTGFHMIEKKPYLHERHVFGFLKGACGALRRFSGTESSKLKAYKKVIDTAVSADRWIELVPPQGYDINEPGSYEADPFTVADMQIGNERSLRASTAQGERITLARSDVLPPGTKAEFTVEILGVITETLLREWLDYGSKHGFLQWRGAGFGRFTYEMEKV